MKPDQLRIELLSILAAAEEPVTTTDARIAIARMLHAHDRPVVAEQVYRALVLLQRRGLVRRVDDSSSRGVRWELVVPFCEIPGPLRGYRQHPVQSVRTASCCGRTGPYSAERV
ncbi:hypothetical protein MBOU_43420 [Mycobacterium bourgelatii]|uniref:Fur family transcriptional regulator n=1 Tax=Mycobacterium bourgelatii TaxID=1273442 RepID=A0A7I9YUC2_MYCBU|nr:hypothetical protein MBOU_43420 [Mycobacterium bourgelatii]